MERITKRRWRHVRPAWQVPGVAGSRDSQDAVGGWTAADVVVRGRADGLHAYDLGTGAALWSWIAPGRRSLVAMSRTVASGVGLAVHADDSAGYGAEDCVVTAVGLGDGGAVWSVPLDLGDGFRRLNADRACRAMAVVPDRAVLPADGGLQARALDSGRSVWPPAAALQGDVQLSVCRDGIAQLGLDDGRLTVRCLDAAEGTVRWESDPSTDGPVDSVHVLHTDPLALLCRGRGRRGVEAMLVLDPEDGRTTARIPVSGAHGELRFNGYDHAFGVTDDQRVTAVRDLLAAVVRPANTSAEHLTAFAVDGGAPRWTWRSEQTVLGVLAADGDIAVVSEETYPGDEADPPVAVHLLDGATGKVRAVRRLVGYEARMDGRYHLDAHHRLIRVSRVGEERWSALQMFSLR